jgi:hypothetical protein
MTSSAHTGTGEDETIRDAGGTDRRHDSEDQTVRAAGSSADQHITGSPETGEFITDRAPTAGTPAHGSSNAGVNERHANSPAATGQDD